MLGTLTDEPLKRQSLSNSSSVLRTSRSVFTSLESEVTACGAPLIPSMKSRVTSNVFNAAPTIVIALAHSENGSAIESKGRISNPFNHGSMSQMEIKEGSNLILLAS